MAKTKKTIIIITILILTCFYPGKILAQRDWNSIRGRKVATGSVDVNSRFDKGKMHGIRLIEKRLKSLSRVKDRIAKIMRISEEDKKGIIADLDKAYSGLQGLKSQIESASDIESLRPLIESMFYDYRIYAVRLPRERGLTASSVASYVLETRSQHVLAKIEEVFGKLEETSKDVTEIKNLLEEFKGYIEEAKTLISDAKTNFQAMQPAKDLTEAKGYLEKGKANLKEAREKTRQAREVLKKIREALRLFRSSPLSSPTSSPSSSLSE